MQQSSKPESSKHETQAALSLPARIWKYKLHYVLPLPAMLLFLSLYLPALAIAFVLPFKDFSPAQGLFTSSWVGLDHVRSLLWDPLFRHALVNTVTIKLSSVIFGGLVALGLALALHALRPRWLRGALVTLFLVPFVIPSAALAHVGRDLFSFTPRFPLDGSGPGDAMLAKVIVIALVILKTCGIPVALALATIAAGGANPEEGYARRVAVPALRAICAFMLVQLSAFFTVDFELIHLLFNPMNVESLITVDVYVFRRFIHMSYGLAGSAWLVQFVLQLPLIVAAYFLIRRYLSSSLFQHGLPASGERPVGIGGRVLAAIGVSLHALVIGFFLYRLFVRPFLQTSMHAADLDVWLPAGSFAAYLFVIFWIVVFHLLLTVMLAYPLTVRDLPGRGLYKSVLLFFVAAGPMALQQFFQLKLLTNALIPFFLTGLFNLMGVFVLKERFNEQFGDRKRLAERSGLGEAHTLVTLFLPKIWRPLIGLGVLQAIVLWNSYLIPLLYARSADYYSPILHFQALFLSQTEFDDPLVLRAAALISLPPLLLFPVFRRWVTGDLFLSQIRRY